MVLEPNHLHPCLMSTRCPSTVFPDSSPRWTSKSGCRGKFPSWVRAMSQAGGEGGRERGKTREGRRERKKRMCRGWISHSGIALPVTRTSSVHGFTATESCPQLTSCFMSLTADLNTLEEYPLEDSLRCSDLSTLKDNFRERGGKKNLINKA